MALAAAAAHLAASGLSVVTLADIAVPPDLSCSDRPEWDNFRHLAVRHAARGWPSSPADFDAETEGELQSLYGTARHLVTTWSFTVCSGECRSTLDFSWGFVEEWGSRCSDSANFDRYLITHYFRNRALNYTPRARSGFCHYGLITALVIVAQFEFSTSVAQAQRFLFLAFTLLGDFFAFDWIDSSGWPVSTLMLSVNLRLMSQRLITGKVAEEWRVPFPGERGPEDLRRLSRWQGTSEHGKPSAPRWEGLDPPEERPSLVVWQTDGHTALAGEAKTMLVRFAHEIGVDTRFLGNSIADSTCGNYGLCPDQASRLAIARHLDRYYKSEEPFEAIAASFAKELGPGVAGADVIMCGQPLVWCRFLFSLEKPCLMYAGLPVMWAVRAEDKEAWGQDFMELLRGDQHVVLAESVFMARELHWQYGARVPVMRVLGLHTNAVHVPVRSDDVLVSRFGTSGALSECVFDRFVQINRAWFPLKFVQLEEVLFEDHLERTRTSSYDNARTWREHIAEIKVPGMPYNKLAMHRAAISMPYDTTIFLFNELYTTNIPIFVPRDLWRWLIGLHTSPSMEYQHPRAEDASIVHGPGEQHPFPEHSPFYASGYKPMVVEQAIDWSIYTDWALLPHLRYFLGAPDLFVQLLDGELLRETSFKMKAFNEEEIKIAVENWREVAHRLLYSKQQSQRA